MDARFSTAFVLAASAMLAISSANAACKPRNPLDCAAINFTVVPDIAKQGVVQPNGAQAKFSAAAQPEAAPYSGPTLGASTMVRHAPEIGYRWALE